MIFYFINIFIYKKLFMNSQPQINPINTTIINNIIKSNRGRKSTKKTLENKNNNENVKTLYEYYNIKPIKIDINSNTNSNTNNEFININSEIIEENNTKKQEKTDNINILNNNQNIDIDIDISNQKTINKIKTTNKVENNNTIENNNDINTKDEEYEPPQKIYKKRGRKPKGGKIIKQSINIKNDVDLKQNIILHLKCSINDVNNNIFGIEQTYNPNIIENVDGFSFNDNELSYDYIKSKEIVDSETIIYSNKNYNNKNIIDNSNTYNTLNDSTSNNIDNMDLNNSQNIFNQTNQINQTNQTKINFIKNINNNQQKQINQYEQEETSSVKDIWKKISELEHSLHINDTSDKKSDCFWDTCEFDNPPIYIPKYEINGTMHVYGCFCSPECAAAYLMKENIDTTTKFERYHLLNHIYCKIYNYEKNIKPAPIPYYTLNKYYGNLTIQEYRKLLKNERLLLIVDKPLTRQLPELHQDNDDYIINSSIQSCSKYKLRRKGTKQSKNDILNENFGICK